MRLADFIECNMDAILAEWDEFAAVQLPAASSMSSKALRDHGEQILAVMAEDLRQEQSAEDQERKAKGQMVRASCAAETAAQTHAFLRAGDGFNINQMVAEYRALRSSVLRLWTSNSELGVLDIQDMIRFNEAVDQALAESIQMFSKRVSEARDLTLGMFGHDLRNPLAALHLSAKLLKHRGESPETRKIVGVIDNACTQMVGLLEDLVDFNRVRLGLRMQVERTTIDLSQLIQEEVQLILAAYPEGRIELLDFAPCVGGFDRKRLQQLFGNLLANALTHGSMDSPVQIQLRISPAFVIVEVSNAGPTIAPAELRRIFEPLKRAGKLDSPRDPAGSLGLGLYISQQIVVAHEGTIAAESRDGRTTFSVSLPRGAAD